MKVRTVTLGLPGAPSVDAIADAGRRLERIVAGLADAGWIVQTRRIAFARPAATHRARDLQLACEASAIDHCSLGAVVDESTLPKLVRLVVESTRLSLSVVGAQRGGALRPGAIRAACETMTLLARETDQGLGNFRFGIGFCVGPNTPFFPISHHEDDRPPSVSIGTENSGVLVEAFGGASSWADAIARLGESLTGHYGALERVATSLASQADCEYAGIDPSIAPSLDPEQSIARAFESVGVSLGGPGTVALCGLITACLRQLPLARRVGYAGLMLPVLEDSGIALACDEGRLGLAGLLACASVCGVGLDVIPIAADTQASVLEAMLHDLGTVAVKQDKPLMGRLLLVDGKRPGERTEFDDPHLCNAMLLRV